MNDLAFNRWEALRKGSREAYTWLYKYYFDSLYVYGMRFCGDEEIVKDCIQDLFVKLWQDHAAIAAVSSVKNYLFTALRNRLINRLKHAGKFRELASDTDHTGFTMVFPVDKLLIELEDNHQLAAKISEALNQLTARQKEAIYLRFYEDLSYQQTAGIMGVSVKAIYKIIARAIQVLRRCLGDREAYLLLLLVRKNKSVFMG